MPSIRLPSASWLVHHGRIMWITQKVFLLLLFRIEHDGVSKGLALRLIQPDRVQSDDVVYTKIFSRIMTLNVIVPYVVDVFPGYRQEWRILFHDGFGLADQGQALAGIHFPGDPRGACLGPLFFPKRVVLRTVFAIPRIEVVGGIEQGRDDGADSQVEMPIGSVVE